MNEAFWAFYNTLSAAKLFSYNLISFDGVSCKSRNTSEYKLGDAAYDTGLDLCFTLSKKSMLRESFSSPASQNVPGAGAHSFKERGKKKVRVFEVNEKLEIQVTTINSSETLHKINYSFASEARM